jgi:hypothetical protein
LLVPAADAAGITVGG